MALLAAPSTRGGVAAERIDTHASIVFLAGDRAFKLKRAVCYDYLDFSTVEQKEMSAAEVHQSCTRAGALSQCVRGHARDRRRILS